MTDGRHVASTAIHIRQLLYLYRRSKLHTSTEVFCFGESQHVTTAVSSIPDESQII